MNIAVTPPPMSRLSPKASRGWKRFAAQQGCSLQALSEAFGRLLLEDRDFTLGQLAALARQIGAERRGLQE